MHLLVAALRRGMGGWSPAGASTGPSTQIIGPAIYLTGGRPNLCIPPPAIATPIPHPMPAAESISIMFAYHPIDQQFINCLLSNHQRTTRLPNLALGGIICPAEWRPRHSVAKLLNNGVGRNPSLLLVRRHDTH